MRNANSAAHDCSLCAGALSRYVYAPMVFNTSKSKLILFPDLGNTKVIVSFMGGAIEHVADHSHLGCIIGAESDRKNSERTVSY